MKDIAIKKFAGDIWFKRRTSEELRKSGSFNLVDEDGKFIAIVVVPASAEKKFQLQSLAHQGNVALGLE